MLAKTAVSRLSFRRWITLYGARSMRVANIFDGSGLHGARVQAIKMRSRATGETPPAKYQAALRASQKPTGFFDYLKIR